MKVRLLKRARADLDDIFLHIAADNLQAACDLVDRVKDATAVLADFPEIGRASERSRRELTTVWPYIIIYSVGTRGVRVERIVHGARRR